MLPINFRRAMAVVIPIFSAAAFFGVIESMLKVGITENLASTGITLGVILGLLNIYLLWQNYKHLTP